jgi:hypothetical protein
MQDNSTIYCAGTDLTGDGVVDLADILLFSDQWLTGF